jgi:hypothetical protein
MLPTSQVSPYVPPARTPLLSQRPAQHAPPPLRPKFAALPLCPGPLLSAGSTGAPPPRGARLPGARTFLSTHADAALNPSLCEVRPLSPRCASAPSFTGPTPHWPPPHQGPPLVKSACCWHRLRCSTAPLSRPDSVAICAVGQAPYVVLALLTPPASSSGRVAVVTSTPALATMLPTVPANMQQVNPLSPRRAAPLSPSLSLVPLSWCLSLRPAATLSPVRSVLLSLLD